MQRIGNGYIRWDFSEAWRFSNIVIRHENDLFRVIDISAIAVGDALLGAAMLGGVRNQFPGDTIASGEQLLEMVEQRLHYAGYRIEYIDVTLSGSDGNTEKILQPLIAMFTGHLFLKEKQINIKWALESQPDSNTGTKTLSAWAVAIVSKRAR